MKTDKQFIDEIYKKYDEYQKEEKIKRQKKRSINNKYEHQIKQSTT